MNNDFWRRMTTPTEDETGLANAAMSNLIVEAGDTLDYGRHVAKHVLAQAAPRIVADVYRDIANRVRGDHIISGSNGPLMDAGYGLASKCHADMCERLAAEAEQRAGKGET